MSSPYERTTWVPVCAWCGKRELLKAVDKQGSYPPINPPEMQGECNASPTGKHGGKWERY